jgi:hypothetical protein
MMEGAQGMVVNGISMTMGRHIPEKKFQFPLELSKFARFFRNMQDIRNIALIAHVVMARQLVDRMNYRQL